MKAVCALILLLSLSSSWAAPIRVALDTDIGTDFDDTWALFYLLSRPDLFDLQLVQVSTYNTTKRAQIAALILDTLNRTDIPIGIGDYTGEQGYPQYPIAANYSLDTFVAHGGAISYGTENLQKLMVTATPSNPLYIIEIAPATSLGNVLLVNPQLAANCICVAMSGSIYYGYGNSTTVSAEYNVVQNISSSQAVYNATWLSPLSTAPLDTTNWEQWNGDLYQTFLAANNSAHPYVQLLLANYVAWYDNGGSGYGAIQPFSPTTGTDDLYDAQAAWQTSYYAASRGGALPTAPNLVFESIPLIVDSKGYTIKDTSGKQTQTVYPATNFVSTLQNPYPSTTAIGTEIINAIIAAPLK